MKKSPVPISKHTLNLFAGDMDSLIAISGRVGAGRLIRELVRDYIIRHEAKFEAQAGPVQLEIKL